MAKVDHDKAIREALAELDSATLEYADALRSYAAGQVFPPVPDYWLRDTNDRRSRLIFRAERYQAAVNAQADDLIRAPVMRRLLTPPLAPAQAAFSA